ncbi:SAM-dependent methyltransferase [Streptomyces sp. HF10]|uniref:SAM-dependent methyltransferase n=1 Tax=Streptomyces sp. HF10 TaxID=2692233 RepID=UPI0013174AC5|nr:SAM-dependent methyltransferase [Streptomyces sp. HF10]QHC27771.1 SAM-dependent methyltransferase [Streptomyces sp. HF10]
MKADEGGQAPSIARVYDYLLGGKDNYPVDREIGDHFKVNLPGSAAIAHTNRGALIRAVRGLGRGGVRQFVDLGSGLPTADNVHQVAQRHQPGAAVVQVDTDPTVLAHGRPLLAEDDTTTIIEGDVRDPGTIRHHPETERLIDFGQPVGVILSAVPHHLNDDEEPAGIVRYWAEPIAPGGYVFISHFRSGHNEQTEAAQAKLIGTFGRGRWRTDAELRALFGTLTLRPPGIVPAVQWHPDASEEPRTPTVWEQLIAAGLARKA